MSLLVRQWTGLRDAHVGDDGRTVVVAVVPYDSPTRVDDGNGPYREVFRRGAFAHACRAPTRVELRYSHRQEGPPYGFGTRLEETGSHLEGEFRVAECSDGDRILALVREGQLAGVSVGYVAGMSRNITDADGPLTERVQVKRLAEVSLVTAGAYEEARVLAIRQAVERDLRAAVERERLYWQRLRLCC